MATTRSTRIIIRRDSIEAWLRDDPVLAAGEIGYEDGNPGRMKVGNGNSPWTMLDYLAWQGPGGERGPSGFTGETGPSGATGAAGAAGPQGTVAVGTVTTGDAGTSAIVSNAGSSSAAVFNFTIPRGAEGTGGTASVGTVTTGVAGTQASVSNTGTSANAVLNFVLPVGNTGATGSTGPTGATGAQGIQGTQGATGSAASTDIVTEGSTNKYFTNQRATDALATALDLKANSSHAHGNITNVGAIGATTGLPIITTASGVLTTGTFGYTSGQFAQGNDYRIIDGAQIAGTSTYGRVRLADTLAGRTTTNIYDAVTPSSVYYSSRSAGRAKFWECFNDFVFDFSGGITSDGFNLHMMTSSGTAALYLSRFSTQPFGITCTTISGTSSVTTSTTARLRVGMLMSGASIPANCTITSLISDTSFYMSNVATSSAAGATLTFTQPGVGLLELNTGSSSSGYAMVYSYTSEMPRMDDGTRLYECMVQVPLLSDATQEFLCRIGMHDGSTSMTNGIYFEYNRSLNGNFWTLCSSNNSSTTRTSPAVPVVAGAWIKLGFRSTVSGSTITLYPSYNGTEVGSITTNIRADGAMKLAASIIKSVGTTSRSFLVDYVYMRHEWIGSR